MIQMKQHRFVFVAALALLAACTNYQEADVPDALKVDVTELSFSSGAATRSVTVQSGTKWTVGSMPDWVTVQAIASGSGNFNWTITFAVQENSDYDREGVISIRSGSGSVSISVTQDGKKGKPVAVASVSIPGALTLAVGDSQVLTPTISPSNASVRTVTWKSSVPSVATVDVNGLVSAVAEGSATITVTTDDGGKTADCVVTVNPKAVPVTGVTLDKSSMIMTVGDSQTLTATVLPSNATNKLVSWSSNNTSVASVSSAGVVTAKSLGTAIITVRTNDSNKTATCSVTVRSSDTSGSGNEGTGQDDLF